MYLRSLHPYALAEAKLNVYLSAVGSLLASHKNLTSQSEVSCRSAGMCHMLAAAPCP